jgi:hypothetical protein
MKYYVVGYEDTRGKFEHKGVTTNKAKAEKFKDFLKKQLYSNFRQWASIKEVDGIK